MERFATRPPARQHADIHPHHGHCTLRSLRRDLLAYFIAHCNVPTSCPWSSTRNHGRNAMSTIEQTYNVGSQGRETRDVLLTMQQAALYAHTVNCAPHQAANQRLKKQNFRPHYGLVKPTQIVLSERTRASLSKTHDLRQRATIGKQRHLQHAYTHISERK